MEHCKWRPWKVVRHHIYTMFCWFRSLAGVKWSWLKIHGWSHIPRAIFRGTFSLLLWQTSVHSPARNCKKNFGPNFCPLRLWPFFPPSCLLLVITKTATRWVSFLPRPLSSTTSLHWDYCVRRPNINSSVSLQDGWLALKGPVKNLVPSFGASFRRCLLNYGWWKTFCACIAYTGI